MLNQREKDLTMNVLLILLLVKKRHKGRERGRTEDSRIYGHPGTNFETEVGWTRRRGEGRVESLPREQEMFRLRLDLCPKDV